VITNAWFKDLEFWEHFAPVMFDEIHWAEVPDVTDAVTRLSRFNLYGETPQKTWKKPFESAPKVLDLCCGPGRISTELASMGFTVTGVDITESFLETAREDAKNQNLNIEYINCDVREFLRPDYFDLIVNLYISFGYFQDKSDDLLVLQNVYNSLKKDGTFIIETLGKEIAVKNFVEDEWFEREGYTVLTGYTPLDSWTYLKNRWILLKDGKRIEKTFTQRLYSASELRELLMEAGFEKTEIYGDWDESAYDNNANKLIVVCRK
jgi:SAM-dependent methyltransferase